MQKKLTVKTKRVLILEGLASLLLVVPYPVAFMSTTSNPSVISELLVVIAAILLITALLMALTIYLPIIATGLLLMVSTPFCIGGLATFLTWALGIIQFSSNFADNLLVVMLYLSAILLFIAGYYLLQVVLQRRMNHHEDI
jgi:hypothetical protein